MDRHQENRESEASNLGSIDLTEPDAETLIKRLQQVVRMATRIEDRIGDLRRQFVPWRPPNLDYRVE